MNGAKRSVADAEIETAIREALAAAGPGKSIDPAQAAERLAGPDWRSLSTQVRRVAADMMRRGELVILRKGKPVDPDDFRGVIRLRLPWVAAETRFCRAKPILDAPGAARQRKRV